MGKWQIDDIVPLVSLSEGFSPLDIWQEVHANAVLWNKKLGDEADRCARLNTALRMATRLKEFSAERWGAFNHAIGWTKEASSLLSWCNGASLKDICVIWNKLHFSVEAEIDADFSAMLLNPALLPENTLDKVIEAGEHHIPSVCLLIAARSALPKIDIALELQHRLPPDVVSLLRARGFNL